MKRFVLALLILALSPVPSHAAFKASGVDVASAWTQVRAHVLRTKQFIAGQRVLMVAPTVSATVPLALLQHLAVAIPQITQLANTPGLAVYASAQVNDPTYNVVTEFAVMRKNMVALLDALIAAFPKDGSGYVLYQTISIDGFLTTRTFTAAQVAPLVVLMDALYQSID